jgi:hypothetical protein
MKKLRLDVDSIRVERFEATGPAGLEGTVMGHVSYSMCVGAGTCPPMESCNTSPYQQCRCQ